MALLGYARVSTNQQKLDIQISKLESNGVREDRVFTDKASGKTDNREGLQALLGRAEKGDTILVTKLDRLGRNTADMINIIEGLNKKGIFIRFIDDGISTEGTMGRLVVTILSAVAQAERERILERTNEGREAAFANGVKFGRKPHQQTETVIQLIADGVKPKDIMQRTGVSKTVFYRIKAKCNLEVEAWMLEERQ